MAVPSLLQELKGIEDKILYRLSNSEGNPVDDVDLIATLQASKAKSQEIQVGTNMGLHIAVAESTQHRKEYHGDNYSTSNMRTSDSVL